MTWSSGGGPVTQYGIVRYGSEIGSVSAGTFTFTDGPDYQFIGSSYAQPTYVIRAYFSGGTHADSPEFTVFKPSLNTDVTLLRGPLGQPYLAIASPPANLSRILLFWGDFGPSPGSVSIYATNFVNGIAPIPLNGLNGYAPGQAFNYQLISTNGDFAESFFAFPYFAEEAWNNLTYGFADARIHIKENLKFLMRSATVTLPFSYASNLGVDPLDDSYDPDASFEVYPVIHFARPAASTNYEYSGIRVFDAGYDLSALQELRPVQENHLWRNFVFNTSEFTNGNFNTGADFDGYSSRTLTNPKYQFSGSITQTPLPLVLTVTNSSWLYYRWFNNYFDPEAAADVGVSLDGSGHRVLNSNVRNCYGLSLNSLQAGTNGLVLPGSTFSASASPWFPNFTAPALQTVDYYFASQSRHLFYGDAPRPPLPGSPDFFVTNTSPSIVTSVGHPITVAGWAKQAITNGYSNVFGYLEQYFDKAYKTDVNGVATTNQTGLLSPYGEFFPTEAGSTALITLPDIDTNQRGTGIVHVISLNVDANHDGAMDFSFNGPDFTTWAKPYRFWVNDTDDSGDTKGTDIPGAAKSKLNGLDGTVNGVRDLVDFFPVYVNIRGLLQTLPTNQFNSAIQFRLSQGDSALNFVYTDLTPEEAHSYLTNTTVAASLAQAPVIRITGAGTNLTTAFLTKIRDEGKGIILVEARTNTA